MPLFRGPSTGSGTALWALKDNRTVTYFSPIIVKNVIARSIAMRQSIKLKAFLYLDCFASLAMTGRCYAMTGYLDNKTVTYARR